MIQKSIHVRSFIRLIRLPFSHKISSSFEAKQKLRIYTCIARDGTNGNSQDFRITNRIFEIEDRIESKNDRIE